MSVASRPTVGVIAHLDNPSFADIRDLACAAEEAGADWLGIADAFWWRDTWMLLGEAARVTERIVLGPMLTNPYLRHPFHTVAALASLQELAGPRVQLGIGAGGSEVTGAAHISRRDAPTRIERLAALVREVAGGGPLDEKSGRHLDVALSAVPILVAGRGDRVLRTAGRSADSALLWAVPQSDLARSADLVRQGAEERATAAGEDGPDIVWAPLVVHNDRDERRARVIAAYGILNAHPTLRARWDIGDDVVATIRQTLVRAGAAAATNLVPQHVVDDVAMAPDTEVLTGLAASIGARHMAFPAYDIDTIGDRVAWARGVLAST
jgi:5,10-methylenetetrahydromethanopterin reductase